MAIYRTSNTKRAMRPPRRSVKARGTWSRKAASGSTPANTRQSIPRMRRPDFGFPDKLVTNMRYVDTVTLTGAAGVVGANTFRFNSLFDPDLSGIGHQPYYYDQICGPSGTAPYLKYRVLSARATVRFTMVSAPATVATNIGPVVVGLMATATNGLYGTTASALCEASGSKWTYLGDKSASNNVIVLKSTYNPNRDLGNDEGDDTIGASYNANPSQIFNLIPWKVDTVGNASVQALVEIVYKVEFYDRNEVAQS